MKRTIIPILIAGILIGVAAMFSGDGRSNDSVPSETASNVTILDGKQVITITAKGGYSPRVTTAQAGIPTVIKMVSRGTFDCSSALVIPSIGYQENLPLSGETLIDVPAQEAGTSLRGMCSMGMYNFAINFN